MLDHLRHQRDVIALESTSGAAALEHAVSRLPDFLASVKQIFVGLLTAPIEKLFARRDGIRISQKVRHKDYLALREIHVQVPAGLQSDFLSYAQTLLKAAEVAAQIKTDVLQPFAAWLGARLGNPSSLAALTGNLNVAGFKTHATDQLHEQIFKHLKTTGRLETLVPYGQAIRRNADWTELAGVMDRLSTLFSEVHHKEVAELVNQCVQLMDTLLKRLQEEPEVYRLSPTALQALAATSYEVGRELEFYGLMRHRIGELSHALNETAEILDKLPD